MRQARPLEAVPSNPLIRRLARFGGLTEDDIAALSGLTGIETTLARDEDIVRIGDKPGACTLILSGMTCRYLLLPDGKRQIMAFHIAGDICDIHSLFLDTMDHAIGALTPCTVAMIPHRTLLDLTADRPRIARALWRDSLIDAAIFREWLVGVGRRTAYQRVAHLLCELYVQLEAAGLAANGECELPLTQGEVADALGLTPVHVNRMLQELRSEGLLVWKGSALQIPDWDGLQAAGDFDPVYLHLRPTD